MLLLLQLHMLGETGGRGATLEMALTKLMLTSSEYNLSLWGALFSHCLFPLLEAGLTNVLKLQARVAL